MAVDGDPASLGALALATGLTPRNELGVDVWGPLPGVTGSDLRRELSVGLQRINGLLALHDPTLAPVVAAGGLVRIDADGSRHPTVMPHDSYHGHSVTISGRGTGHRVRRTVAERVDDLSQRKPDFEAAARYLGAGDDFADLYKVMEAIKQAHGGWNKMTAGLLEALGSSKEQWDALLRSARPRRHAYPSEDPGPVYLPAQAKNALRQILMHWLDRDVPS